jgi:DNA repair photolyase
VNVSVTSLDPELARRMEPRASTPAARLEAVRALAEAGIPTGVLIGPVIPGLNDSEIPAILDAAGKAGARHAGYTMVRLMLGLPELFERWLAEHYPDRRAKVLARIREVHGGRIRDSRFHVRSRGEGVIARQIRDLFEISRRRAGLAAEGPDLSTASFRRPGPVQLGLFDAAEPAAG